MKEITVGKRYKVTRVDPKWKWYSSDLDKYVGRIGECTGWFGDYSDLHFPEGEWWIVKNDWLEEVTEDPKPTTDDSKYIRRFPSGAVRSDDRGRIRPDYISPYALKAIGEHFANNKNDFGATNYYLGIPERECASSIMRHYLDLMVAFEENNSDLVYEELKALAANCIMALHTHVIKRENKYREIYNGIEYIKQDEYLASLGGNK